MMSLSAREQKDLDSIAVRLAAADPGLASLLGIFGQLAVGEEMPLRENIRLFRPQTGRGRHCKQSRRRRLRTARKRRQGNWMRIALVLCYLAFIGLVLGTLVSLSGHGDCADPGMVSCAARGPARAPFGSLGGQGRTAGTGATRGKGQPSAGPYSLR